MKEPSSVLSRWSRHCAAQRAAVIDSRGTHTWAELNASAEALARRLLGERSHLGGERVALFVEPGARFVEALYGVLLAGGCAVVLSPLHPSAESAWFVDDAQARTLLVSDGLRSRLDARLSSLRTLVVDAGVREGAQLAPGARPPLPRITEEDDALQIYTSGTTGKPKGAVLTHGNLGAGQSSLGKAWGMCEQDVLLHCLPLHHVHGLCIALLNVLGAGGCARLLPGFDARAVWEGLAQSTVFMAVPTIYAKLFEAFDAADDGSRSRWQANARQLRLATSGSAALPVSLGERWRALTDAYPLERYGMTEIGVALSNPLEQGARRPGWVGRPVPEVVARIVDEQGDEAETGELWIAGPGVFRGYFQREEATRASFSVHGELRYFRTGDTVTRDGGGNVRILGRTSVDILKSGGYKLSALELEELFRTHPAVSEVAVVGLPDEVWGDRVVACVIPSEGRSDCAEEVLRTWAKAHVAAYKVPRNVLVTETFPRNAMGKVVKPELVRWAQGVLAHKP